MSFLNLMGNKLKPREVNDALINGGGGGGGAFNISDTETKVNYTYNGKDVYCKEFIFGAKSFGGSAVNLISPFDLVFDKIVDATMYTTDTGNANFTSKPITWPDTTNKILYIQPNYSSSVASGKITLYYTK